MFLHIAPTDYFFFRDSKPFDAGVDSFAKTLFPPPPSTVYGAVRTAILVSKGIDLNSFLSGNETEVTEVVGKPYQYGTLKLAGPWLAKLSEDKLIEYFPPPLSLVIDNENRFVFLKPDSAQSEIITNLNPKLRLPTADSIELTNLSSAISSTEAVKILIGDIDCIEEKRERLFERVYKVGIKRNTQTRTVLEQGALYTIQMLSFNPDLDGQLGVACLVSHGELLPEQLLIKFGGESRVARATKVMNSSFIDSLKNAVDKIVEKILANRQFFIWLITPAIFKNGFIPDFVNPESLEGELPILSQEKSNQTLKVKLLSLVSKSFQAIGGFDLAKGFVRPLYRAVPAGSVYFFEITEEGPDLKSKVEDLVRSMNLNTLHTEFSDFQRQGFGTILLGGV